MKQWLILSGLFFFTAGLFAEEIEAKNEIRGSVRLLKMDELAGDKVSSYLKTNLPREKSGPLAELTASKVFVRTCVQVDFSLEDGKLEWVSSQNTGKDFFIREDEFAGIDFPETLLDREDAAFREFLYLHFLKLTENTIVQAFKSDDIKYRMKSLDLFFNVRLSALKALPWNSAHWLVRGMIFAKMGEGVLLQNLTTEKWKEFSASDKEVIAGRLKPFVAAFREKMDVYRKTVILPAGGGSDQTLCHLRKALFQYIALYAMASEDPGILSDINMPQ